jgi:hypothetical protein
MKVIASKYLPSPIVGLQAYLVAFLSLERFGAPGWLYGFVFCLLALCTIAGIIATLNRDSVHPSELDRP